MPMRGAVADVASDEGEKLLRERIEDGEAFNRILVYMTDNIPEREEQIILRRNHATFVF